MDYFMSRAQFQLIILIVFIISPYSESIFFIQLQA